MNKKLLCTLMIATLLILPTCGKRKPDMLLTAPDVPIVVEEEKNTYYSRCFDWMCKNPGKTVGIAAGFAAIVYLTYIGVWIRDTYEQINQHEEAFFQGQNDIQVHQALANDEVQAGILANLPGLQWNLPGVNAQPNQLANANIPAGNPNLVLPLPLNEPLQANNDHVPLVEWWGWGVINADILPDLDVEGYFVAQQENDANRNDTVGDLIELDWYDNQYEQLYVAQYDPMYYQQFAHQQALQQVQEPIPPQVIQLHPMKTEMDRERRAL